MQLEEGGGDVTPFSNLIVSSPKSNSLGSSLNLAQTRANRSASSNVFGAFDMTNFFKIRKKVLTEYMHPW